MRIVSWMYLFKNYTVKDWVSFCEVYGMPLRIGKYDPGASEVNQLNRIKLMLSTAGKNLIAESKDNEETA